MCARKHVDTVDLEQLQLCQRPAQMTLIGNGGVRFAEPLRGKSNSSGH